VFVVVSLVDDGVLRGCLFTRGSAARPGLGRLLRGRATESRDVAASTEVFARV
jgi:hypothetical protein